MNRLSNHQTRIRHTSSQHQPVTDWGFWLFISEDNLQPRNSSSLATPVFHLQVTHWRDKFHFTFGDHTSSVSRTVCLVLKGAASNNMVLDLARSTSLGSRFRLVGHWKSFAPLRFSCGHWQRFRGLPWPLSTMPPTKRNEVMPQLGGAIGFHCDGLCIYMCVFSAQRTSLINRILWLQVGLAVPRMSTDLRCNGCVISEQVPFFRVWRSFCRQPARLDS